MQPTLASRIIDRIDAGQLSPTTHQVCRRLAGHLPGPSSVGNEVIRAFDQGRSIGDERLSERLWAEIESLPLGQQGGRRILVSLVRPNETVDFHLADYVIAWSQDEGLSDAEILAAFDMG